MADEPGNEFEEAEDTSSKRGTTVGRVAGAVALLIIVALILALLLWPKGTPTPTSRPATGETTVPVEPAGQAETGSPTSGNVTVPSVMGATEADARSRLTADRLGVRTAWQASGQPQGSVIHQYPSAGVEVPENSLIDVTLSLGLRPATSKSIGPLVPSVLGKDRSAAASILVGAGYQPKWVYAPSTSTQRGLVFYQKPGAETEAARGTVVTVWISNGTPPGFPYPRPED